MLVVDNDLFVRTMLTKDIGSDQRLELVGVCADGSEAVAFVAANPVDVVLMDLEMPEVDGYDATREIIATSPSTKVLAFSTFADDDAVARIVNHGAIGLLSKIHEPEAILVAIRLAHAGLAVLPPETARRFALDHAPGGGPALEKREQVVLKALAAGSTNQAMARDMFVSSSTIKAVVRSLSRKLGATSRADLVAKAHALRLVR